jgi:hypothetical protein
VLATLDYEETTARGVDPCAITFSDLLDRLAEDEGWTKQTKANARSDAAAFCRDCGLSLTDPAYRALDDQCFTTRLSAATDKLASRKKTNPRATDNMRWAANAMKRAYDSLVVDAGLPLDFVDALDHLMKTRGYPTQASLAHAIIDRGLDSRTAYEIGNQLHRWLHRKNHPNNSAAERFIRVLEAFFNLPAGVLVSRSYRPRPKLLFQANPDGVDYRKAHAARCGQRYRLKALPPQFEDVWNRIKHWRSSQRVLINGHRVKQDSYWSSAGTESKNRNLLLAYLGYLTLPKLNKPAWEATTQDLQMAGQGIPEEEITLRDWFSPVHLWGFADFNRSRTHNNRYTATAEGLVGLVNSFVSVEASFFKNHHEFAPEFGLSSSVSRDEWVNFVEENLHKPVLGVSKQLREHFEDYEYAASRSPDEPLKKIFLDKKPLWYFYAMIDQMRRDLPPRTHEERRATALRDIALFQMCLEQPLRHKNIVGLTIGRELTRDDATGLWHLHVSKAQLKNWRSPHADNIDWTFSLRTSKDIDAYMTERRHLHGAGDTNIFLLRSKTGIHRRTRVDAATEVERYGLNVYYVIRRRLLTYFGEGMGSNVFRHVVATAILKDDPERVATAAAVLNNSKKMIEDTYGHLTRKDKLRGYESWRDSNDLEWSLTKGRRPRARAVGRGAE